MTHFISFRSIVCYFFLLLVSFSLSLVCIQILSIRLHLPVCFTSCFSCLLLIVYTSLAQKINISCEYHRFRSKRTNESHERRKTKFTRIRFHVTPLFRKILTTNKFIFFSFPLENSFILFTIERKKIVRIKSQSDMKKIAFDTFMFQRITKNYCPMSGNFLADFFSYYFTIFDVFVVFALINMDKNRISFDFFMVVFIFVCLFFVWLETIQ